MDVQPPVESAFCEESVNKFRQAMDVHSPAVSNLSVRIPSRSSSPRSAAVKSATPKDQLSICSFPPYCPNPKLQLKEILETLKRHISEKYIDILRAFRNYDKRAGGLVLRSQLKQILRTYCIPLTEAQFFDVMKEYNFADKAQINYKEFLEYFASFDKIQQETVIPVEEVPSIIPAEELEVILKHKISQNLSKIIQGMWLFDVNKDGNIQRRELRKIIENYCCALTDVQFKSICNRYDPRNSGLVNYKDFLIRLGINVSRYEHLMPKDIVEKAIKWPLKLSEEEMTKIKLAQIQQRASREGRTDPLLTGLTTDEVFQVLKHKLKSRGHLLERAFKAFDPTDRGFVSLDDFHGALNYVIMPMSDSLFKLILFRLNLLQISPNRIFYRDFLKDYCQPHKLLDEKDESKTDDDLIKHFKRLIPNPEKQLKSIFSSEEQADENKASPYEHIHEKKLKEKLKAYVVRNYQEIGKAIMARDHQQSGLISCEDFKEILDYFCFSLSDIQFQEIVSDFDVYRGSFNYKKFLDLYKRSTDEETEKWIETMNRVVPFKSTESTQLSSKEVEAYLREAVQAKRNTFLRDFTALDYADVGLVKKPDVKLLFDKHAFRMSEHQFEEIWKMFPVNPFNKLIYKKFLEEFGNVTGMNPPTPPESPKVPEEIPYPYRSDSPRSIVTVDMYEERKKPRVRPKTPFPVIKELMNPIKIPQSPSLYKWPERTKVVTAHGVKPGSPINVKDSSLEITVRDRKDDEVTAEDKVWPMSRQQTLMGKEIEESIDKYPPVNPYTVVTTTDIHLQKRILWRWRDIVRKCKLYDKNNKGVIAEENFTEILRKGGIPVNKKDTETQLIQRYGIVSGVPVNYWDFLRKFLLHVGTARSTLSPSELTSLQELRMSMPKPPPLCVRMSASSRSSAQYLLEDLITKHYKDIKKRCEAFDPTDEGVMLGEQLRRILQESGISVNNDDIARELEQQGISNGVSVDYWHFISKNVLHLGKRSAADNIYKRRKLPPARVKVPLGKESAHLNETLLSIRFKVMKNFMNLSRMFYRYDKNMTGLVKSEVFRKFLLKFGVVLKEEGLFSILEYYDPNLTGKIPYADFLRAFVRSA